MTEAERRRREYQHEQHGGDESPDYEGCLDCREYMDGQARLFAPPATSYTRAEIEEGARLKRDVVTVEAAVDAHDLDD